MKSPALFASLLFFVSFVGPAVAARIDMNEPHRAVGRENDVRVDAQLLSDVVRAGSAIAVTYQIHNQTGSTIAVAEKLADASYDSDSRTITVSLGSEIPPDGAMPRMATIAPGEKKTFTVAATLRLALAAGRTPAVGVPRFLQIKVSVLQDIEPFASLFRRQENRGASVALDDQQFDAWLETKNTIFLNALPIRFEARSGNGYDASNRRRARGSM